MQRIDERGYSLLEVLLSMAILVLATGGLSSMLIQSSRINKSQQMHVEVQSNARNTLAMIVAKLRSAGWDPYDIGFAALTLDPDTSDDVSQIEIFADVNSDNELDGTLTDDDDGEQILIRHSGGQVEWRLAPADPFIVLATNITNDADGDGTIEAMFQPDSTTDPTRITVQLTARSPVLDPVTREFIVYTVASDVFLRKTQ